MRALLFDDLFGVLRVISKDGSLGWQKEAWKQRTSMPEERKTLINIASILLLSVKSRSAPYTRSIP